MKRVKAATLVATIGIGLLVALSGCMATTEKEPLAMFTATTSAQLIPFTASFDATPSYDPDGDIASYLWDFGDGGAGSGPVVDHTYQSDGEYVVKLTVIDGQGLSSAATMDVEALNPPPSATFTYSPRSVMGDDYVVGASEWISFDASGSSDDGEVEFCDWNFGDGCTDSGATVQHRFLWPGTYNVVLTVTDEDGGTSSFIRAVKIIGGPPCNADLDGNFDTGGDCS